MRYHFEKPFIYRTFFGKTYMCDHPLYDRCTLYLIDDKGLAVIQQRRDGKKTYWTEIDSWIVDRLYVNPNFRLYFDKHASEAKNRLFPTVTVRQIMWGLRMKPLKREPWETCFDHCPV